jgi:molybdate transport system regulatory protein
VVPCCGRAAKPGQIGETDEIWHEAGHRKAWIPRETVTVMKACGPRVGPGEEPKAAGLGADLCCRTKVWLECGGMLVLSEWRLELLTAVDEAGSLSDAAERLGVPYRTAWYKLKDSEEALGTKLLLTHSGGAEGGHSELTPEARELLTRFRRVTAGIAEYVEARFRAEFGSILD